MKEMEQKYKNIKKELKMKNKKEKNKKFLEFLQNNWTIKNYIEIIKILLKEELILDYLYIKWIMNYKSRSPFSKYENTIFSEENISLREIQKKINKYFNNHEWLLLIVFKMLIQYLNSILINRIKKKHTNQRLKNYNIIEILIKIILDQLKDPKKEKLKMKDIEIKIFPQDLIFIWYDLYKNKKFFIKFFFVIIIISIKNYNNKNITLKNFLFNINIPEKIINEFISLMDYNYNSYKNERIKKELKTNIERRYPELIDQVIDSIGGEEEDYDCILDEISEIESDKFKWNLYFKLPLFKKFYKK